MESNTSFSFLRQEDELQILDFPELATLWDDVGFDHVSPPKCIDIEKGKEPKKLEKKNLDQGGNQKENKKVLHREVERQRRQEISTLYASLRSVLPPQHIKGKRSTSDQIDEAVKYIRHMQNSIKELGIKRDNLKRWGRNESHEKENPTKILPTVNVKVQKCSVGVEVLISGDFMTHQLGLNALPLSRIMQLLLEEGLIVVSCNFTKFDGKLLYMIQSEVNDNPGLVDIQMLQRKLSSVINLSLII